MQEKNFAGDTVRLQSYLELLEVALIVKYATHWHLPKCSFSVVVGFGFVFSLQSP